MLNEVVSAPQRSLKTAFVMVCGCVLRQRQSLMSPTFLEGNNMIGVFNHVIKSQTKVKTTSAVSHNNMHLPIQVISVENVTFLHKFILV